MGPHTHFFALFFVCGCFFPLYLVFFSLTPQFCRARKSAFEHRTLSRNSSSWCVLSLSLSSLCQSFRADERGLDASRAGPGGCGGRAVGFRARDGVFCPSGVKGSPQNRVGEDARAYLAWDVAMFEDDFPRAM